MPSSQSMSKTLFQRKAVAVEKGTDRPGLEPTAGSGLFGGTEGPHREVHDFAWGAGVVDALILLVLVGGLQDSR